MTPLLTDDELPKPRYYVVNGYLYTSRGAAENCARMISPTEGESLPVDALYTAEQMRARDRAVEARVRETPLFAAPPPSAPQPEAQPVAWMLRSVRGDAFHAGSTPPQPVDVFPWVPLYAAPPQPAATPCPHIRSSGTGEWATNWCALNGPPSAPEPSEAEVAAAMASLHRDMEPAAWPSEDEVTDALRAAAAARKA